ncbi:DUF805 domain-containing protein [Frondihabitans cladoniiphilus]|uniref:DUF805 domain-containing protein n=1 Tax=Frondihabitans cladoniiphilus TaxID=715785 RepID=A0ABP8VKD2_9MICO
MTNFPPPPAYQQPAQPFPPKGEPPLWAPHYGISFIPGWRRAIAKYADFTGRAAPSEFWFYVLGNVVVVIGIEIVFSIIGAVVGLAGGSNGTAAAVVSAIAGVIVGLYSLAVLVPTLAVTVRRLHDANYAWGFIFFYFIWIVLLILLLQSPKPEGQRFDRPRG